ncbi:hypothetical protein EDD90_10653 [Streptomyces sp. Ag109_O5-1]|uniref:DUF6415 family natural product biosynthesis protein n=1 Tax=Streptomyces sp. Ag109_O5-1 TaxID=1938851 RepID=UPI000F4E9F64|nr:DUF6415 family natural product biosynthesis protein [Streptomyces sp. Ag109_O5-1]RPE47200.1 hypothetical protein EDD90_10653 [Streptomyces sp. Ag109_O5-1]
MTAGPSAEQRTDDPIPALIAAAFDSTRRYPEHERFVEIDKLLREEIERLQIIARRMADRTPHRSYDWYRLVNAVDRADDACGFQLGTTLQAALQVSELARRVAELRQVTAP